MADSTNYKRTLSTLQRNINKSPFKLWFVAKQVGYKNPNHFSNILASRRKPKNNDYSFIEKAYVIINSNPLNFN